MRFQSTVQIFLIVVSVVILVTVVKPKFAEVQTKQEQNSTYSSAIEKAAEFNAKLQGLINQKDNFSASNMSALAIYLPESIDGVTVARDIENIIATNQMILQDITFTQGVNETGGVQESADDFDNPFLIDEGQAPPESSFLKEAKRSLVSHTFEVEAVGFYEDMKEVLKDFEQNRYPLRLVELTFDTEADGSLVTYSFTLETYTLVSKSN